MEAKEWLDDFYGRAASVLCNGAEVRVESQTEEISGLLRHAGLCP